MAARRSYTVETRKRGLNLRAEPSKESKVLSLLPNGSKVQRDGGREAPEGWMAVKGGGFVMTKFLK